MCSEDKEKVKVSVVILTYNAKSTLGKILDEAILSALNQDYPNIEVLVVDNGSNDDTYDYVKRKYGDKVKVYRLDRNYGYTLGNNLALRFISKGSRYVLFQNPDAVLRKDYVKKLISIVLKNPSIVAIQGLELQLYRKTCRIGGTLNTAGYYALYEARGQWSNRLCLECLLAFGAALLVNRRVFELVGGFPSDYFMYYDEADLGFRLRALGLKVVGTTVTSYLHYVSGTVSRVKEMHIPIYYFTVRNRLLTILKYFPTTLLLKALALNSAILLLHFIKGNAMKRRALVKMLLFLITRTRYVVKQRKLWLQGVKKHRVSRFVMRWPATIGTVK